MGSWCLTRTEPLSGLMKRFWKWAAAMAPQHENAVNATELCALNGNFYIIYIFYHNF